MFLQRLAGCGRSTLRIAITRGNARRERTNRKQNHERTPTPALRTLGIRQAQHLGCDQLRRFYHIELGCRQASVAGITLVTACETLG